MYRRSPLVLFMVLLTALVGCGTGNSQFISQRAKYVLDEEPSGAIGVLDLRENIVGQQEVLLVGQIGGIVDPWSRGQASFVITDPIATIDGEGHPESCGCPFCKEATDQTEGLALVQFIDAHGSVLQMDAQRLFGIQKDQVVVVLGQAELNQLGHLVVSASGLYVRR